MLATLLPVVVAAPPAEYFAIEVVDQATGRGVPLVELRTVNNIRLYTDSAGLIAFREPGLMGSKVFFHVRSHGYEFPRDHFGYRGQTLQVTPGGRARLKIRRINVAQRLYRVTGGGIYRDSLLLGRAVPLAQPVLNGRVFGSDSVNSAVFRGKVYWFWGDTNRPKYPLGNFKVPGATSKLPAHGGLDPRQGVDLEYFLDATGFAKQTAPLPAKGPTWLSGLVVLGDGANERMFAHYVNIRGGGKGFEVSGRGLVEFDPRAEQFRPLAEFPLDGPFPGGAHPFLHRQGGTTYVYYCDPYPLVRVEATVEKLKRLQTYEAFTCLQTGSRLKDERLDRDAGGRLRWDWKADTDVVRPADQARLLHSGKLAQEEALLALRDIATGQPILAHRGSVYHNAYRGRWVMIFCQAKGTSPLGEIWYAEADRPTGPWLFARKILTHDHYSFYNPKQHPMFDQAGGRVIFFEGTYTHTFSGNPEQTPRYDYNQIMYQLDLDDPRLNLPVAIYTPADGERGSTFFTGHDLAETSPRGSIAFWALDRPGESTLPVHAVKTAAGGSALTFAQPKASETTAAATPLFYVLRPDITRQPPGTVPLFEFRRESDGRAVYATRQQGPEFESSGYRRQSAPVGLVWGHPLR